MDALKELLYGSSGFQSRQSAARQDPVTAYVERLSTLSTSALTSTESEALSHDHQSLVRSLQALAKRSYKSINSSAVSTAALKQLLPPLSSNLADLQTSLPGVESKAVSFSTKYAKPTENPVLDKRRRAMRLGENLDKVSNVLELPTLLQSTISASASTATAGTASTSSSVPSASYAQALDLYAHIKRLQRLYPESQVIASINLQAEEAMRGMTTRILSSLRSQNLKLAGAMRLIGLMRRLAPELEDSLNGQGAAWYSAGASEGSLGLLFLISRLINLSSTFEALEPLQDLADHESEARRDGTHRGDDWAAGQQTERYLKRFIEVFREQCFSIVSMYKSIFPSSLALPSTSSGAEENPSIPTKTPMVTVRPSLSSETLSEDTMQRLPPAVSTFTFELVELLTSTLKAYLPNIKDNSSRDSLLTQVLYCASSLGRLGGDFGLMVAVMQEELEEEKDTTPTRSNEWIDVTKRHRVQAGRLEILASGVGASKSEGAKDITVVG